MNEQDFRRKLFNSIKVGSRVTILVPNGIGRNGTEWKEQTGRAVIPSCFYGRIPGYWALDMGGKYGTPGVCDIYNLVAVANKRVMDPMTPDAARNIY